MAAEIDNTDYDKLFPRCIGCSNHMRQHRGGTMCWCCARYYADLYAAAYTKVQNGHIAQHGQPAICTAGPEMSCQFQSVIDNSCSDSDNDCNYKRQA